MKRRSFLKQSCGACLLGGTAVVALLESCGATAGLASYKALRAGNTVSVPLDKIPVAGFLIVQAKGADYSIAVRRAGSGLYEALWLECTHFSNQVAQAGDGFVCNAHGSRFDAGGKVRNGPAEKPLKQLATAVSGTDLLITLS